MKLGWKILSTIIPLGTLYCLYIAYDCEARGIGGASLWYQRGNMAAFEIFWIIKSGRELDRNIETIKSIEDKLKHMSDQ